jgi:hypothetical protein
LLFIVDSAGTVPSSLISWAAATPSACGPTNDTPIANAATPNRALLLLTATASLPIQAADERMFADRWMLMQTGYGMN